MPEGLVEINSWGDERVGFCLALVLHNISYVQEPNKMFDLGEEKLQNNKILKFNTFYLVVSNISITFDKL
jgi:hypothetical protein